eukprot:TRINITY_DN51461_c0_g2_i1.p1 TRINITY_DN51461_c0_g2~~TRINITY_DN51461_c0_g2_i1.p1  ORF type:complete len:600 (-),score=141.94 TRINITY_DN51461_c0_g2_i1:251-2050(-)
MARTCEPDIVVGVDFGTRGTGFSWTRVAVDGSVSTPVFVDMGWHGETDRRKKTSTSILFKGDLPLLFGIDAENRWDNYVHGQEEEMDNTELDKYFLFRVFKMQLCDMDEQGKYKAASQFMCRSVCGKKSMTVRDVIAGSLKLIKELVFRKLQMIDAKESDEQLFETTVKWVLTVPTIWSERGKTIMKDSARMARLLNFEIALEPECVALTIRDQLRDLKQKIWENRSYIVIDAGGGTIDIIAHTVDEGKIHEMADATGCPWGSTNVDKAFICLFEKLFEPLGIGARFFSEGENEQLRFELMKSFEVSKDGVGRRFPEEHLTIRIPYELFDYLLKLQTDMTFRQCCSAYCLENGFAEDALQISSRGGALRISEEVYKSLVKGCIDGTVDCLRKYVDHLETTPGAAFFVGGFSRCPFLTDALNEFCDERRMRLVVSEYVTPDLAVVNGAALYGKDPDWIASRIARFSIGVVSYQRFNPREHQLHKANQEERVKIFVPFIVRGERIGEDSPEIRHVFSPIADDVSSVKFSVVNTRKVSSVIYADDPELLPLGDLVVTAPEGKCFMKKDPIDVFFMLDSSLRFRATQAKLESDCTISLSLENI